MSANWNLNGCLALNLLREWELCYFNLSVLLISIYRFVVSRDVLCGGYVLTHRSGEGGILSAGVALRDCRDTLCPTISSHWADQEKWHARISTADDLSPPATPRERKTHHHQPVSGAVPPDQSGFARDRGYNSNNKIVQ